MSDPIIVEIVGLKYSDCSPFPCDADRTCGLSECHPSGKLTKAFDALKAVIKETYGDRVDLRLTLIDDEVRRISVIFSKKITRRSRWFL